MEFGKIHVHSLFYITSLVIRNTFGHLIYCKLVSSWVRPKPNDEQGDPHAQV